MDCSIKKLFITLKAPNNQADIDFLRRWVYDLFSGSKLLKNFTRPSCRPAATRKAKKLTVDLEAFLKKAAGIIWKL